MSFFGELIDKQTDICIGETSVMSGVRPEGRIVDHKGMGRKDHGILYIWDGECRFREKGKNETVVRSRELVYIPKGCEYIMRYSAKATTFVLVNLNIFSSDGAEKSLLDGITVILRDDSEGRIATVMSELELNASAVSFAAALRRKELVYRLLRIAFEKEAALVGNERTNTKIFGGVMLLQQTYLENLPISEFAKASNLSISAFRSLFAKEYGMSPLQYRNMLRIKRAETMLREGSCTVSEAAYASGFENLGYFCRYYKRMTGETPSYTKNHSS